MKKNFNVQIKELDGKPAFHEGKPLFITQNITNALLFPHQDETGLSGEEKIKRALLAQKIHESDEADYSIDELALIKTLVGKNTNIVPILVYKQIVDVLETSLTEVKATKK